MKLVKIFEYEGTVADQYIGQNITISGNTLVVKMERFLSGGLAYVYERINGNWKKTSELRPFILGTGFAYFYGICDNTIVIGAYGNNNIMGSIYIYEKILGNWILVSNPKAEKLLDQFGYSVSVSNNFIATSCPNYNSNTGKVYLYKKYKGEWILDSTIDGEANSYFGSKVSISGNFLVVAGPNYNSNLGKIYIYEHKNNQWNKIDEKIGEVSNANFGYGNSISDNYLSVIDKNFSTFIYEYKNKQWILTFRFNSSGTNTTFNTISNNNNIMICGNPTIGYGVVYTFIKDKNGWKQFDNLTGENSGDGFGSSVWVSGNYIAVGAYTYNNNNGKFYIYELKN